MIQQDLYLGNYLLKNHSYEKASSTVFTYFLDIQMLRFVDKHAVHTF